MNDEQLAIAIAAVLISTWLGVTSYLTDVRLETYYAPQHTVE